MLNLDELLPKRKHIKQINLQSTPEGVSIPSGIEVNQIETSSSDTSEIETDSESLVDKVIHNSDNKKEDESQK